MVCPYRVVVAALTVVLAVILGWTQLHGEEETRKRKVQDDTKKEKKATEKSKLYRGLYLFGIITLVFFHFELFTGGYLCRQLFGQDTAATKPIEAAGSLWSSVQNMVVGRA